MNIKGQCHSLILVQGHSDSTFSNFFSLETARLIEVHFHLAHLWDGGTKNLMVQVTWPIWPPCLFIIKTFNNLLLWNQKADDLESWYAVSVTRVLPNLFKWWPLSDLNHFMTWPNLFPNTSTGMKVLIQQILSSQVSDTGPMVFWVLLLFHIHFGCYGNLELFYCRYFGITFLEMLVE